MNNNVLPLQLTSLVGREQEMTLLGQLLRRPGLRLVTITGPFGVGKTSLALAVAHQAREAFADGVFFVSLAPISDPTLIVPSITQALNVPESPRRLELDSLKEHLQDRHVLLVLDNFEQIISAAPLLSELLSACARLQMLVTSRESLRLRGEQEFLLAPLAVPDASAGDDPAHSPSVALFVQRAQAAQLDFQLSEENATAVAEICAYLDGLPLAIELAAARIRLFPPRAMLAQLRSSSFQLLRSGVRDLPERQQTLRRAIQWSSDLLSQEEKQVFRWLAVFVGGSSLAAAQAVLENPNLLDVVDSLVSKSLLRRVPGGEAPRLTMLETIREFGWQQLEESTELEKARRRHAAWYTWLAEEAEPHLAGAEQNKWLRRMEVEQDNLRAALRWAIEARDGEVALRLVGALAQFWFASGRWTEGRRSLEDALALEPDAADPVVRARALYQAGSLARYQGDYAHARVMCSQSLVLYRALNDELGMVVTLVQLGRICLYMDDHEARKAFVSEAASLIESLPDSVAKARAYKDMALTSVFSGDLVTAEWLGYVTESERIHRAFNNIGEVALAISQRSSYALLSGAYAQAESLADEAERLVAEFDEESLIRTRVSSARILLHMHVGEHAAARRRIYQSILSAGKRNDQILPITLVTLAAVLFEQGLAAWSAQVLGLADELVDPGQRSADLVYLERMPHTRGIHGRVRAHLGDERYASYFAAGRQLTLDDLGAIPDPAGPGGDSIDSLTPREDEVLQLLGQEMSNSQIAQQLVISRRTVDAHLRSIYDKLGVSSRDAATRMARERGLLAE